MPLLLKTLLALGYSALLLHPALGAQELIPKPSYQQPWKRSLLPLLASQSLDAASSWGYRELNPMLADSRGAFGAKAVTVKFGVMGAFIAVEYFIVKKHPGAARVFSRLNWSAAAVTTGFAVRNYRVR